MTVLSTGNRKQAAVGAVGGMWGTGDVNATRPASLTLIKHCTCSSQIPMLKEPSIYSHSALYTHTVSIIELLDLHVK